MKVRVYFSLDDGDEGKSGMVFDAAGLSEEEIEQEAKNIAFECFEWSYEEDAE